MGQLEVQTKTREELVDITSKVQAEVERLGLKDGFCLVYVPHTTAGVTINEGADPSVKADLVMALSKIVSDSWPYRHGEGNSPAHVKSSLVGPSVLIPVEGKRLTLGTWQAVFFCEFDGPRRRKVGVSVAGTVSPS